jgi:hypothetical protein
MERFIIGMIMYGLEMIVHALDEISVPELLFVGQLWLNEHVVMDDHPCKVTDTSRSRSRLDFRTHNIVAEHTFTRRKGSLRLVVACWLHVWRSDGINLLLSISDKYRCSLIRDDNISEENVVPNEALARAIKDFWAGGERNVTMKTAEARGAKGVVSA